MVDHGEKEPVGRRATLAVSLDRFVEFLEGVLITFGAIQRGGKRVERWILIGICSHRFLRQLQRLGDISHSVRKTDTEPGYVVGRAWIFGLAKFFEQHRTGFPMSLAV